MRAAAVITAAVALSVSACGGGGGEDRPQRWTSVGYACDELAAGVDRVTVERSLAAILSDRGTNRTDPVNTPALAALRAVQQAVAQGCGEE